MKQFDEILKKTQKELQKFSDFVLKWQKTVNLIGDCLNKKEMKNILSHLTDLNKPWHCPHGRQTIRHLWDLRKSFNSIANNMND